MTVPANVPPAGPKPKGNPAITTATSPTTPTAPETETKSVYISYFDAIDFERTKALMGLCSQIVSRDKPDELYFLFSSPGGQVLAGITLYNFLRSLPVKIVMHNIGSIDSIATVIFLAGDERYATKSSSFLFHGVAAGFKADASLNLSQLKERVSSVNEDENKIARIITDRTNITDTEIRTLFSVGESKDPTFAKEKGFIHDLREAEIPSSKPFITVNFQGK